MYLIDSINQRKKYFFPFALVLLFFLMAFKDTTVGPDTPHYVNFYLGLPSMYGSVDYPNDIEPGLGWLCRFLWIFPKSELLFIFTTTLFTMLPVFYGIHKYSKNKIVSVLLIMLIEGIWLVQMITLRQALAQSFILIGLFCFLDKGKWWFYKTGIALFLSFFFHSSPFLIVPLMIIAILVPIRKKSVLYIALIVSLIFSGIFANSLSNLFLSMTSQFGGLERVNNYIENDIYGETGYSFLNYAPMTLFVMSLVYYNNPNDQNWLFVKAFALGIIAYNILGSIPLVNRAIAFLLLVGVTGGLPSVKKGKAVMICFLLYMIWRSYVHYEVGTPFQPYKFIFE